MRFVKFEGDRVFRKGKWLRQYYFRIVGANGECMAASEGYNSVRSRSVAIRRIKEGAANADVILERRATKAPVKG